MADLSLGLHNLCLHNLNLESTVIGTLSSIMNTNCLYNSVQWLLSILSSHQAAQASQRSRKGRASLRLGVAVRHASELNVPSRTALLK